MSLNFNGKELANVSFNGKSLSEVQFNGATVWTSDTYIHLMPCKSIKELVFSSYMCPGEGLFSYTGVLTNTAAEIKMGDVIRTDNTACTFVGSDSMEVPYNYGINTGWTSMISHNPQKGEIVNITTGDSSGNYITYRKKLWSNSVTVEGHADDVTFVNNTPVTLRVDTVDQSWITIEPYGRYNTYSYGGDHFYSFHDANYGYQVYSNHKLNKKPFFWGDTSSKTLYLKNPELGGTFSIAKLNSSKDKIESWVQKGFYLTQDQTKSFVVGSSGYYVAFEGDPSDSNPDTGPWMCCALYVRETLEIGGSTSTALMGPDGYVATVKTSAKIHPNATRVTVIPSSSDSSASILNYNTNTGYIEVSISKTSPHIRPGFSIYLSATIEYYV